MENEIFEVERSEFKGFIDQIKPEMIVQTKTFEEEYSITSFYSRNTNKCLAKIYVPNPETENLKIHFYVFEMPEDNERRAAKPVQCFTIETMEELQAFFEILNKLKKDKNENE